ncbi:MAG TPA: NAD-dependent epimerase/dehydratase family protein [Polyangiaceae bacterium]|nr:NAD-dependent epimerase/dehydratase family protein [Polyangiaceae bacterium]
MTSNEKASKPPLHVIVGAGQIGPNIAARLLERGLRVRLVQRRTPSTAGLAGVETARADVSDPDSAARAFEGASVVYHTANPVYTEWPRLLLPLTRGIAAGATRAGAHLVVLDNLYMYGRAPGGVMREDTPVAPCSAKGELRAEAAHVLLTARDRGELAVTIGRASDFFGPGATLSAIFGPRFWQRALRGKPGEVFGDPNQPHSYSYVRDVADALVTLGTDERAKNRLWHLPVNPAEPTRTTIARAARALGIELGAKRFAPRLLSLLGVVSPMLREVAEMTYQWEAPFVLDDSRFRDTFGVTATPWDPAMNETAAWGRTLGRS